jgi:hypothetical protein
MDRCKRAREIANEELAKISPFLKINSNRKSTFKEEVVIYLAPVKVKDNSQVLDKLKLNKWFLLGYKNVDGSRYAYFRKNFRGDINS